MKYKFVLSLLMLVCALQMGAQTPSGIGGVVSDEHGEAIVGATVKVKGTTIGAITDANGRFTLPDTKAGQVLEISYVGMEPVTMKAKHNMSISMQSDAQDLDEVIVVAFGQQKKSSFTGSAGVVKSDKIASRQVTNVVDALNGQVSGVQMINTSGEPNATPTIRIRGISSINAGNDPLIVVDGAPFYGSWSDINPADVASITVLKDAASNALYGARGANGVIMITTKNPQKGKTVITLDAKWGSNSRASQEYDVIKEPGQYYELYYKALYNYYVNSQGLGRSAAHVKANQTLGKNAESGGLGYICYDVPDNQFLIGSNGKLNPNATLGRHITYEGQDYTITPDNWLKNAYRNTLRQEYNANINGGNESTSFYASLGYLSNPGIAYGSDYERYTARMKATYTANNWLKVGGNVNFAHSESDYAADSSSDPSTNTFYLINRIAPIYPLYLRDGQGNIMTDSNGKLYDYGNGMNAGLSRPVLSEQNPLKDDQIQSKNQVANSFYLNGFADITPTFLPGLKLTVNGTVSDYEYRYGTSYQPFYGWGTSSYPDGEVSKSHYRYYTVNFQQLLNYTHTFAGKHNVTLMLGHENYRQTDENVSASRLNMFSYWDNQELSGAVTVEGAYSEQANYNTEGYFFRAMYDYDSKYFGQFSYRRDASSRFHPDHRWGNFYSFGGAWIVSKEGWMASTRSWLDMLKVKFSFGQQGNDNIGDFLYMDLYNISNADGEVGLTLYNKGNETITWEKNTNINAGVEFEMFKSRLRGSIEYFYRKSTDMLCWVNVPLSLGYSGFYDNIGDMRNQGVELDLSYDILKQKDLQWTVNLNATHYRNQITYLYDENKTNSLDGHPGYVSSYRFYGEGLPIYTWRLRKYAGVSADGQSQWYVTGADGKLSTTTTWSEGSYYNCGNPAPDLYGGFGTSFAWKGFDLAVNFTYSLGGKIYDSNYQDLMGSPVSSTTGFNFHKDMLNAWSETNTTSNIPRLQYNDTYANYASDRWLTSGSYLSLQSVNLGYTLPTRLVRSLGLTKVRLYGSADNVYLWSKRKGLDPRTSFTGAPSSQMYAFVRTISGGITLTF